MIRRRRGGQRSARWSWTRLGLAVALCFALLAQLLSSPAGAIDSNTVHGAAAGPMSVDPVYRGEGMLGQFIVHSPALGREIVAYCQQLGIIEPGYSDAEPIASTWQNPEIDYLLWRHGETGDGITAAALAFLIHTREPNVDPNISLSSSTPGLAAQVMARVAELVDEGARYGGPYTVEVSAPDWSYGGPTAVTVRVVSATGNPVPDMPVSIAISNGSGNPPATTGPSGVVTFDATPADRFAPMGFSVTATGPGPFLTVQTYNSDPDNNTLPLSQQLIYRNTATFTGNGEARPLPAEVRLFKETQNQPYQTAEGAQFTLAGTYGGPYVHTIGTDGYSVIAQTNPGPYTITETSVPDGLIAIAPANVTIEPGSSVAIGAVVDGEPEMTDLTDDVAREGRLSLIKRDATTLQPLVGARFLIEYDPDNDRSYNPTSVTYQSRVITITSELNEVVVDGLQEGWYRVSEIQPPASYTLANDAVREVYVKWNGSVILDYQNRQPKLTSQASTRIAKVGEPFHDIAMLSDVADATAGTMTAKLYGPYSAAREATCGSDKLVQTETFPTLGSGEFPSPDYTPTEAGVYLYTLDWVGTDSSTTAHGCNLVAESVTVSPSITTEASLVDGAELSDTVTVSGVPEDVEGKIRVELFGPFGKSEPLECTDASKVDETTFDVTGPGVFTSRDFPVESFGTYTFVATWEGDDDTSATHECGLAEETLTVEPEITTKVSKTEITTGDPIHDVAIVSNVPENETGQISVQLFGPFEAGQDMVCAEGTQIWQADYSATGSGEHPSPEHTPEKPGRYTFVETWKSSDSEWTATHDCGLAEETFTVKDPTPKAATPTPKATQVAGATQSRAASTPSTNLARTGTDVGWLVPFSLVLLLLGLVLVASAHLVASSHTRRLGAAGLAPRLVVAIGAFGIALLGSATDAGATESDPFANITVTGQSMAGDGTPLWELLDSGGNTSVTVIGEGNPQTPAEPGTTASTVGLPDPGSSNMAIRAPAGVGTFAALTAPTQRELDLPFKASASFGSTDLIVGSPPQTQVTITACSPPSDAPDILSVDCAGGNALTITGSGAPGYSYPTTVSVGYSLDISSDDGIETVSGVLTVNLGAPGAPTAGPDRAVVSAGGTVEIPVDAILLNDSGTGELTFEGVGGVPDPASAGEAVPAVISGSEVVRFTASADAGGTATLSYSIVDAFGQSAVGVIEIEILAAEVSGIPVAVEDELVLTAGDSRQINVLSNDADPNGDAISLVSVGQTGLGTIEFDAAGTVTFTAGDDAEGSELLAYTISDGTSTAQGLLMLVVNKGTEVLGASVDSGGNDLANFSAGAANTAATSTASEGSTAGTAPTGSTAASTAAQTTKANTANASASKSGLANTGLDSGPASVALELLIVGAALVRIGSRRGPGATLQASAT